MKRFLVVLMFLLPGCKWFESEPLAPPEPGVLRLATFNAHYLDLRPGGPRKWDGAHWQNRRLAFDQAFKDISADIIAFQEMESFGGGSYSGRNLQKEWLSDRNPDYAVAAFGDPVVFPITQPIFYRTSRLTPVDQGFRFFSETPDTIYSRTYNGGFSAFVTWVRFRVAGSEDILRVFNAHLDYASRPNQRRSAILIADLIRTALAAGDTVFVLIDLNSSPKARPGETLVSTGLSFADVRGTTYHFNRGLNVLGPVDQILYSQGAQPKGRATVFRRKYDGVWPSDHYPVVADFRLLP